MSHLVIVAATGGIGRHILTQALDAGHDVTAVVRNPDALRGTAARVVRADLTAPDPDVLLDAVAGTDAVLSGLGARTGREAGVASRGTRAIVAAMATARVRRIVVVSAASVGTVPSPLRPDPPRFNPGDGPMTRLVFAPVAKALFRPHYADLAIMEDLLRSSALDWTVSRPPRLLNRPLHATYRTATDINVRGGTFISRADVAHHMLAMLDDPATIGHAVGVAY
ncbi:NAD(P)-dependent oxidoreductase [Kineosporia mesophila]|nr:NAD(P)H-binding protein [Kineosporia mesophila]MCD5352068.1 NAD(P)H-binding protein [Kineosporia mesophila]